MNKSLKIIAAISTFVFTSVSNAASPAPDLDDNGNASFVRQVVPKLLGRKPRGNEEVRLLSDIAALSGREAVVRALMTQPEFEIHWARILVDNLKVQREGGRGQSSQCFPETEMAWGDGGVEPSLAEFVRDNAITSDFGEPFNMTQLLLSSIRADNLFPAYRGNLYALGAHPPPDGMRTAEQVRAEVGKHFDDVYLNRDMDCISCHRGTYSTTGVGDRTHPLYKTLDLAVFDFTGQGEIGNVEDANYQTYCAGCHGSDGTGGGVGVAVRDLAADTIAEVLINPGTAMKTEAAQGVWGGILDEPDLDQIVQDMAAALGGPFGAVNGGQTTLRHFASFRPDFFELSPGVDEIAYSAGGWGPWDMNKECAEIFGYPNDPAIPAFFAGFSSDFATVADIDDKLTTGYHALPAALPGMAVNDEGGNISGDVAAAYLLAASITEQVWKTIMGEPLTLVNRFARNADQKNLHKHMTEQVFIANDWSLKELILEIVQSTYFNRGAPASSMAIGPYTIQPVYDPFAKTTMPCALDPDRDDDRGDDNDNGWTHVDRIQSPGSDGAGHDFQHDGGLAKLCPSNGQGDAVHRYAPTTLLNAIGEALDWPAPKLFPGNQYPDMVFAKSVGQYISDFDGGDPDVGFQSLLNWDDQVGTCEKPANAGEMDWIDRLHDAIDGFNVIHPGEPLTLRELVFTVKDWIIQEPGFGGYTAPGHDDGGGWVSTNELVSGDGYEPPVSEAQLVSNFFQGASLDDPVDSAGVSKSKLRELCGVYTKTPQFMLAGIIRNDNFDSPRLRVCNDEPCDYKSMCQAYAPALDELGAGVVCNADSVSEPLEIDFNGKACAACDESETDSNILSAIQKLFR